MGKKKNKGLVKCSNALWAKASPSQEPAWKALGAGIRTVPIKFWEPRMLFFGAKDTLLKEITGQFPSVTKDKGSTHPLFVIQRIGNYAFSVCPCTSRKNKTRYIESNCTLEITGRITDRRSFILDHFAFSIPADSQFDSRLLFMGIVPEDCIGRSA